MIDRLRLICRVVWSASPSRASTVLAMAVLSGVTSVLLGVALRTMVDAAIDDRPFAAAVGTVVAAVAFGTLGMGDRIIVRNMREHLMRRVAVMLDTEVLGSLAGLPQVDHLDNPDFLDRVNLLKGRGEVVAMGAWGLFDLTGLLGEVLLGAAVLAVLVDPLLGIVPLLVLPLLLLSYRRERHVENVLEDTEHLRRASNEIHDLFSQPGSGQEMRLSRSAPALDRQAAAYWEQASARRLRAKLSAQLFSLPGWVLLGLGLAGAIARTADLYFDGRATLGDVVLLWLVMTQLRLKVGICVMAAANLAQAVVTADRLDWLRRYAVDRRGDVAAHQEVAGARLEEGGLVLEDVSFIYPDAETAALRDIDLHLPAGSTVAIVGVNGAGKTTLGKLLCQLYQPTAGRITVGGADLASLPAAEWRAGLTASFQDFMRLEAAALTSVGVGDLPRVDDRDAVEQALGKVEGQGMLQRWPQGLDTHLGTMYEPGIDLSVGEWQKVAGARTLMRSTPRLVVVDEPTSALDPPSELAMFQRFADSSREARLHGAIVVLISHRFSTVRMADLIVVLDHGLIVDAGTHDDLMSRAGMYSEMFDLQARAYA